MVLNYLPIQIEEINNFCTSFLMKTIKCFALKKTIANLLWSYPRKEPMETTLHNVPFFLSHTFLCCFFGRNFLARGFPFYCWSCQGDWEREKEKWLKWNSLAKDVIAIVLAFVETRLLKNEKSGTWRESPLRKKQFFQGIKKKDSNASSPR